MMSPNGFAQFLIGFPWFGWIAIVAIICGAITKGMAMHHAHVERIEMIRQGMHPDGGKSTRPEL